MPFALSFYFFITTFSVSTFKFLLSIICATLSRSLLMQFRCSSPPFLLHFLGICSICPFFVSHVFYMTSLCTPRQFLLRPFLHSNLHSHLIHFLLSALLIPTIITNMQFFANLDLLLLFLCQCHRFELVDSYMPA